jgi:hypothetical protein
VKSTSPYGADPAPQPHRHVRHRCHHHAATHDHRRIDLPQDLRIKAIGAYRVVKSHDADHAIGVSAMRRITVH